MISADVVRHTYLDSRIEQKQKADIPTPIPSSITNKLYRNRLGIAPHTF